MIRAAGLLARDERIPKPLRWVAGLALLPIPGPVDEVVLVLIAPVFFVFFRGPMREAWARTAPPPVSGNADYDSVSRPHGQVTR
jgi:hypothetical protein